MSTAPALTVEQSSVRTHELTVVDVRAPGEYASGHLPGARNSPRPADLDATLAALAG